MMKKTSRLSRFFKLFWWSSQKPNMIWDKKLNDLMDSGRVTKCDEYVIEFDNMYSVWIKKPSIFFWAFTFQQNWSSKQFTLHQKNKNKVRGFCQ